MFAPFPLVIWAFFGNLGTLIHTKDNARDAARGRRAMP